MAIDGVPLIETPTLVPGRLLPPQSLPEKAGARLASLAAPTITPSARGLPGAARGGLTLCSPAQKSVHVPLPAAINGRLRHPDVHAAGRHLFFTAQSRGRAGPCGERRAELRFRVRPTESHKSRAH